MSSFVSRCEVATWSAIGIRFEVESAVVIEVLEECWSAIGNKIAVVGNTHLDDPCGRPFLRFSDKCRVPKNLYNM
jgi:hypothetical protein